MINPKKLRILFVDDDDLEVIHTLKSEGYDVEHWKDVENLSGITDGRYHVAFLDVRGVGERYGGNGLDILKYVATHNPLIYTIVFSAKPFTPGESEIIRQHAKKSMEKDCTFYEITEALENFSKSISTEAIISQIESTIKLGWFQKYKIRQGKALSDRSIQKLARTSGITKDAISIISNITGTAAALVKLFITTT